MGSSAFVRTHFRKRGQVPAGFQGQPDALLPFFGFQAEARAEKILCKTAEGDRCFSCRPPDGIKGITQPIPIGRFLLASGSWRARAFPFVRQNIRHPYDSSKCERRSYARARKKKTSAKKQRRPTFLWVAFSFCIPIRLSKPADRRGGLRVLGRACKGRAH